MAEQAYHERCRITTVLNERSDGRTRDETDFLDDFSGLQTGAEIEWPTRREVSQVTPVVR